MEQEEVSKVIVEKRSKLGAMKRLEKRLRRLQEGLGGLAEVRGKEPQHFSESHFSKDIEGLEWLILKASPLE